MPLQQLESEVISSLSMAVEQPSLTLLRLVSFNEQGQNKAIPIIKTLVRRLFAGSRLLGAKLLTARNNSSKSCHHH